MDSRIPGGQQGLANRLNHSPQSGEEFHVLLKVFTFQQCGGRWCADRTALQPVARLNFTSLRRGTAAQHPCSQTLPRRQVRGDSLQCDKWCVFAACSFPLSNSQQRGRERERKKRRKPGESGNKEREGQKRWGEGRGYRKGEGGVVGRVFVLERNSPLGCNWR